MADSESQNWKSYADFEREKLRELGDKIHILDHGCFGLCPKRRGYSLWSDELIGYSSYYTDSESSRLLKRAEFLKAVCEKEGVEFLPTKRPVEYRACINCSRPFPCSFTFTGRPICEYCFKRGDPDYYTKDEIDRRIALIAEALKQVRHGEQTKDAVLCMVKKLQSLSLK